MNRVTGRHDVDTPDDVTPPPDRNKGLDKSVDDVSSASNSPSHTSRTNKTFTARCVQLTLILVFLPL